MTRQFFLFKSEEKATKKAWVTSDVGQVTYVQLGDNFREKTDQMTKFRLSIAYRPT